MVAQQQREIGVDAVHPYERRIMDLTSELARAEVRLAMFRELHRGTFADGVLSCAECGVGAWPCASYLMVDAPFGELASVIDSRSARPT